MFFIFQIIYFFLPAGVANMSPVIFKFLPLGNYPIDGGKTWGEKRIFGDNKTWRGLFVGITSAIAVIYLQKTFSDHTTPINLINYQDTNIFILGFLQGAGTLFGDLIKSFFKRRIDIPSSESWVPFDQIDWIIGSFILTNFYINISTKIFLIALVIFGLLHPVVNLIGYWLKIKKNKF